MVAHRNAEHIAIDKPPVHEWPRRQGLGAAPGERSDTRTGLSRWLLQPRIDHAHGIELRVPRGQHPTAYRAPARVRRREVTPLGLRVWVPQAFAIRITRAKAWRVGSRYARLPIVSLLGMHSLAWMPHSPRRSRLIRAGESGGSRPSRRVVAPLRRRNWSARSLPSAGARTSSSTIVQ